MQDGKTAVQSSFRLFNPDTMAKPTAGYSQVAEVTQGTTVYIAGQEALDQGRQPGWKRRFSRSGHSSFREPQSSRRSRGW